MSIEIPDCEALRFVDDYDHESRTWVRKLVIGAGTYGGHTVATAPAGMSDSEFEESVASRLGLLLRAARP